MRAFERCLSLWQTHREFLCYQNLQLPSALLGFRRICRLIASFTVLSQCIFTEFLWKNSLWCPNRATTRGVKIGLHSEKKINKKTPKPVSVEKQNKNQAYNPSFHHPPPLCYLPWQICSRPARAVSCGRSYRGTERSPVCQNSSGWGMWRRGNLQWHTQGEKATLESLCCG